MEVMRDVLLYMMTTCQVWECVLAGTVSTATFFLLYFFVQALISVVLSVIFGNLLPSEERYLKGDNELCEQLNLHNPLLGFYHHSQELVICSVMLIPTQTAISATGVAVSSLC